MSKRLSEHVRNLDESVKGLPENLMDDIADDIEQLEAENERLTETLDAIKDGKSAEYWRFCFHIQQKSILDANKQINRLRPLAEAAGLLSADDARRIAANADRECMPPDSVDIGKLFAYAAALEAVKEE